MTITTTMIITTTMTMEAIVMVEDFLLRAVLAGSGIALLAGPLGCVVVCRRMAYFGDTLSHAALLGELELPRRRRRRCGAGRHGALLDEFAAAGLAADEHLHHTQRRGDGGSWPGPASHRLHASALRPCGGARAAPTPRRQPGCARS